MALEDDAIAVVAGWLTAAPSFTGTIIQATSTLIDIAGNFAIIDIAEEGVSFTADGNGSFNGSISVSIQIVYGPLGVAAARKFSSDVRRDLVTAADTRLLSISTEQIAMLEPEDSPYAGRWGCQLTLELFCRP